MKKTARFFRACSRITSIPSPHTNVNRSRILPMAVIRVASVSAYQRDFKPFPFSPCLMNVAPGARMPSWNVRFLTIAPHRNACSAGHDGLGSRILAR